MRCIFTNRTIGMTSFSIGTNRTIGPSVWRIVSVCIYWTCVFHRRINYCSFILGRTITKKMYHCISFYCIVSEITSKTRASGFIRGSKHLERIKALGLRPRAFICFSVFGTPDETLALVFDILLEALVWSQHIQALMNVLAYVKCFIDHTNY